METEALDSFAWRKFGCKWCSHLSENSTVKSKIDAVRKPYTRTGYVKPGVCNSSSIYWNMFSETCLHGALDVVVGSAREALHRSN